MNLPESEQVNIAFIENGDDSFGLAKIMTAMSNSGGGLLYIGVKSNGKVKGIYPEHIINQLEEVCSSYCKPSLPYKLETIEQDFKLILCVTIFEIAGQKYQARVNEKEWESFVRINRFTLLANKIIKRSWSEEKKTTPKSEEMNLELTFLLKIIQSYGPLTLSKLYKVAELPLDKVDKNLSCLVYLKEVAVDFDGNSVVFSLKNSAYFS